MAFDRTWIDRYAGGGEHLAQAIRGLDREDLLAAPPDAPNVGKWTIQQVVVHLMDSDLIWTARMKSIIAEDHPQIIGYDESKFAGNLHCESQDAQTAAKIFELNRREFTKILRQLPDAAFARTGHHNERGTITLAQSVQTMAEHLEHHVKFIHAKRAAMGKEMW